MSSTTYPAADDDRLSSDRVGAPLSNGSSWSASTDKGRHEPRPDNEFLDRVVQGAHQAIDRLADGAAPHLQRLQQGMASAGDTLKDRADQARDMGDEWAESLRCSVRDHPLTAVAAALVAGVLIARLTRR